MESYSVNEGHVFIFDNVQFEDNMLDRPPYSREDTKHLKEAFEQIDYEVVNIFNDLPKQQILIKLEHISKKINDKELNPNPLVAIFLTHGSESRIRGTDKDEESAYIFLTQIMEIFSDTKCKSLKDIPKIFILIACRGGNYRILQSPFLFES